MSAFPDISSVPHISPVGKTIRTKSIIKAYEDGSESAKQKWLYPKRNFKLSYSNISKEEALILWQMFINCGGQYLPFSFFDYTSNVYTKEYVGVGDGVTTQFSLPSKSAIDRTLYLDNLIQSESTNWTFTSNGGSDSEDLCTFSSAPLAGSIITFSFTGYLKVRCRFANDNLDYDTFYKILNTTGIELRGLLNS